MSTTRQIAQLAGVSRSTVSLALRHDPRVRPDTRERILAAAKQLGYAPPQSLPRLLVPQFPALGVLIPDISNHYYARLIRGILREAYHASFDVLLYETPSDATTITRMLKRLTEQGVKGIILKMHNMASFPMAGVLHAWSHGIPVVGVDLYFSSEVPIDQVHTDEERIGRTLVEYLVGMGHRRIAFVGAKQSQRPRLRAQTVLLELQRRGLPAMQYLTYPPEDITPRRVKQLLTDLYTDANPPTAIIGWDDHIATLLVQLAPTLHLRVPRDLSIIGCGNMNIGLVTSPALTTVEQFPEEIGRGAMRLLLKRLTDNTRHSRRYPEKIAVRIELVARGSCAPPRRRE
ncbi:MAG: LacI family DNA-binding transcriptional regulator [Armatimonadota bacterium]